MEQKKAKVVMLPTEGGDNFPILKNLKRGGGLFIPTPNYYYTASYLKEEYWEPQHLYLTVDEEIKEGKEVYYIDKFTKKIASTGGAKYGENQDVIIATTDASLRFGHDDTVPYPKRRTLPSPSQAFIKKYCELGGIDEVLVEYEMCIEPINVDQSLWGYLHTTRPKVDPVHNTITVREIKQLYSPQEILDLLELHGEEKLKQILMT